VTRADTVVLGLGLATLIPDTGQAAIDVSDVDGVAPAGLLIDASQRGSQAMVRIGDDGASADHAADPPLISDVFFRVGGVTAGKTTVGLQVNSDDVLIDHT
jgi:hypothetical protein